LQIPCEFLNPLCSTLKELILKVRHGRIPYSLVHQIALHQFAPFFSKSFPSMITLLGEAHFAFYSLCELIFGLIINGKQKITQNSSQD